MRVAYVCGDRGIPVFGRKGSSIHVQEVVRALLRRNARVELFAHRLEGEPPTGLAGLATHSLPAVEDSPESDEHQRTLRELNDCMRETLEAQGPFDAIYERYSLWSFGAMEYAQSAGVPGVLEVNAPLIDEQLRHRGLQNPQSAKEVARRAFGAAKSVTAVSEEVADYLRTFGVGDRVQVVPNAVDPGRFPEPVLRADSEPFTVGFLGSLRPWHGLTCLCEAFALIHRSDPTSRLLVVGDGPERAKLESDLARLGIEGASELTGAIAPDDVPGALARMDVAVSTVSASDVFYFSPLKVFEYMAAGLPVVASRVGQLASIIDEGSTGFLCPPGDARALAAELEALRADPELRKRVGRAARKEVLEKHTWDSRVEGILQRIGVA